MTKYPRGNFLDLAAGPTAILASAALAQAGFQIDTAEGGTLRTENSVNLPVARIS